MKRSSRRLMLLALAGIGSVSMLAANGRSAPAADPATIVAAERGFAASVRSLGVRDGFLAWLAPTGVVFRPGPVNGVGSYQKLKPGWSGLLAWRPAHAAISAAGDLGWSTGPWTWRRDSTQKKADAHGEYMSVWRKQSDGSWKAVLDCGIGHADPGSADTVLRYANPIPGTRLASRPLAARQSLYQADASFARLAATTGMPSAIERYASDDVIVLREGAFRWRGRGTSRDSVAAREKTAHLMSNAQYIADSGDLGYTYGSYVSGPASAPDSAYYVHVWQRGPAATWRLAFEVVMPVPKPEKK